MATDAGGAVVVVDGKASSSYRTVDSLKFSKDGRHYSALLRTANGPFVLFDGQELDAPYPLADFGNWFFVDLAGPRYAYPRKEGDTWKVVVDGNGETIATGLELSVKERLTPEQVEFSPDGRRYLRQATRSVIVSGKELPDVTLGQFMRTLGRAAVSPYVEKTVFSPDSQYMAFVGVTGVTTGHRGQALFLNDAGMLNDTPGGAFAMPRFSADSRHFAYVAQAGPGAIPTQAQWRVFINGKAGPIVDSLFPEVPESFGFQPDGRLLVLAVKDNQLQRYLLEPRGTTVTDFIAAARAQRVATPAVAGQRGTASPLPAVDPRRRATLQTALKGRSKSSKASAASSGGGRRIDIAAPFRLSRSARCSSLLLAHAEAGRQSSSGTQPSAPPFSAMPAGTKGRDADQHGIGSRRRSVYAFFIVEIRRTVWSCK